ncbi:MAG: UDP-N-acetylmuramoyl-L-alanine--D-glutamate ligase [Oligoflexia bacterium]|nr:UDP-N-acetylmuramoyl-L-alanine--D-glutamate ligase [Oligoflexia bacterium]MBF0364804.1 UDP-N-acetylmuramoyl-L-alanine--D-glutamate ligase [Oligoflexia bacterium]
MERFKHKKVLIVGIGRTGFALLHFFNQLECDVKVTDVKPIFELNKGIKRLKKFKPVPEMTFGEHRDEDFLDADVVVYSSSVNPKLPQLELAREHGKEVYCQLELAHKLCNKPTIVVCGSFGRTTVTHMIGHALRLEGKNVFVGGSGDNPFINLWSQGQDKSVDYVVVEVSALELQQYSALKPMMVVFTNIGERYPERRFKSFNEYLETKLSILKGLGDSEYLIVNFDKLYNNSLFSNLQAQVYWYSRKSFINQGVIHQIQGTHFHDRRIHSNIHCHSEFIVSKMRIVGENNRENLLAAISACKALKISDNAIQTCIEKFPGIPHRLEFVMEKNGVCFYNDSKSETMEEMTTSLNAFKGEVILIAGGKETDQVYDPFFDVLKEKARVLVLVGESKERINRSIGDATQTFLVGSFEESVLLAYQKSRTGDVILLSPGNRSTDIFRDYEERGNYFKKLVYQL